MKEIDYERARVRFVDYTAEKANYEWTWVRLVDYTAERSRFLL